MKFLALATAVVLVVLAPRTASMSTAAKHYPRLNSSRDNAWVAPVQGTHGLGEYMTVSAHWSISVRRGAFGSDMSDDYCSRVNLGAQVTDRPFDASFLLAVHNSQMSELRLKASSLSLVWGPSTHFTASWEGPVVFLPGTFLLIEPGQTKDEYISFSGLPRSAATYSLQVAFRGSAPGVIGVYSVTPNDHNPCA